MLKFFLFFLILVLKICDSSNESPRTRVQQGEIKGGVLYFRGGKLITAFLGVPYAKPPIGKLRFNEPEEPEPWEGVYYANRTTSCARYRSNELQGSEDCLYLNIYTPKLFNPRDNFSVVVHIHGGSFQAGSPLKSALPDYLIDRLLVYVTINYRLGALGFLTDDDLIPGNIGLKDQSMALKWIKNNIRNFGGNPDSITLTGFSAGAMSVHYHYLSPLSKGLFHRGYSMSGTALNPRALDKNPVEKARKFVEKLNCPWIPNDERIKCLHNKTIEQLTKTNIEFRPVIEHHRGINKFLPEHPYKLIINKKIHDVPWVVSNVIDEAFVLTLRVYGEKSARKVYNNWLRKSARILELENTVSAENLNYTLIRLKDYYFNQDLDENKTEDQLNRLMTDRHYLGPSDLSLRLMSRNMKSPVYYSLSSFIPEDRLQCAGKPAASHCTDARLLFKWYKNPDHLQMKGGEMMRIMTRFIKTYADTGIPQFGYFNDWNPVNYTGTSLNILNITTPDDINMVEVQELFPRELWGSLPIEENEKLFPEN